MHRPGRTASTGAALLGAGLLLAGCAGEASRRAGPDGVGLDRYPEAQDQIVAYYASQGSGEPSFDCGRGRIEAIDRSRIVADTPVEVIFEVTYRFSATSLGAASLPCSGSSTRWFTFDREGDGRPGRDGRQRPLIRRQRGGQARGGWRRRSAMISPTWAASTPPSRPVGMT
jgi:hypothetical protein